MSKLVLADGHATAIVQAEPRGRYAQSGVVHHLRVVARHDSDVLVETAARAVAAFGDDPARVARLEIAVGVVEHQRFSTGFDGVQVSLTAAVDCVDLPYAA